MKMSIYVQIASYRDPELIPTIKDCIAKAKNPNDLHFGLCIQYGDELTLKDIEFINSIAKTKVIILPYTESKGACWARHKLNILIGDEEYALQLDSHHRFIQDWDEILINLWKSLDDEKAIITGYPPNYFPDTGEDQWYHVPQICNVYKFDHLYPISRPADLKDHAKRDKPVKGVYIAAGFIFSTREAIVKVPYDPDFYFTGEECAMAVRYFTHGFNLYNSNKKIVHHYYSRPNNKKHWGDHVDWGKYNILAHERLDCLLGRSKKYDLGLYGLGKERTLEDYRNYAGIDFEKKIVHKDTAAGEDPPCNNSEEGWDNEIVTFNGTVNWDFSKIPTCEDTRFWAMIIKDQDGIAIHREDLPYENNKDIIDGKINTRKFNFDRSKNRQIPTTLMIWPYSESKQWIESSSQPFNQI